MNKVETALQRLTKAERWLAEAKTLDDLKQIHDVAIAAEAYAKAHHLGLQAENHAMEIRLLAARRIGELCPAVPPMKKGGMGGRGRKVVRTSDNFPDKQRLSEFRKLAQIPIENFKGRIEDLKLREEKITYNKFLSNEKPHKKLRKDKERKFAQLKDFYDVEIRQGDFQEVFEDIEDQSVDCIFTDPPYGKDFLPLWDSLGKFAARVLCKDGLLITYSGQMYLPEIILSLLKYLDWWWLCGIFHKGMGNLTPLGQPVRKVINEFKPVLMLIPRDGDGPEVVFHDLIEGAGPEKDKHNWQQPVDEAKFLLRTFCEPGDLIIDPFAGSGSFGEAAKQLGMKFIGAEILKNEGKHKKTKRF